MHYGNKSREPWIAAFREGAMQALSLDAGSPGNLGKSAACFGDAAQRDQEHLLFHRIFERRLEILGRKFGIFPEVPDHRLILGDA